MRAQEAARARTESAPDRLLKFAAGAFTIGLLSHGIDHALRGTDVVSGQVQWAGNVQVAGALVALLLVFIGHRYAPMAAIVIGFASAVGFTLAHLLPTWSVFSDSFVTPAPGTGVTAYSWVTAVLEIGTALVFGVAGVRAARHTAL